MKIFIFPPRFLPVLAVASTCFLSSALAIPNTTPDLAIGGTPDVCGLAFGADGRVFVSEFRGGDQLETWPSVANWTSGAAPSSTASAISGESVAVNSTGTLIAVAITENGSFVDFYHLQGGVLTFIKEIGGNTAADSGDPGDTSPVTRTNLAFPRGLRFDSSDNLWISDDEFHRFLRIPAANMATAGSSFLPDLVLGASNFTTSGSLGRVKDVAFDGTGNLYGVNFDDQKIVRFNQPFTTNRTNPDVTYNLSSNPVNIAFSGSTLYVSMPNARKVWSFNNFPNLSGGAVSPDAIYGPDSGTFQLGGTYGPQGVALDAAGNLYVCDLDNARVVRFSNPDSAPAPVPASAPIVMAKGKTKISTEASKITLHGTATNATSVEYQQGKSKYRPAKGSAASWSIVAKLGPGKNVIKVQATGPGGSSKVVEFVVTRK